MHALVKTCRQCTKIHKNEAIQCYLLSDYSINNKLQQPESAAGVLEYAMKHHRADLVRVKDMHRIKFIIIKNTLSMKFSAV